MFHMTSYGDNHTPNIVNDAYWAPKFGVGPITTFRFL
jgi:hypothetical protein